MLSMEDLEEFCGDVGQEERDFTAFTIFSPTPNRLESLEEANLVSRLNGMTAPVMLAEELADIEDVTEAFLDGVQSRDSYEDYDVSDQVIRRYVNRFLRSIGNSDDQVVFGDAVSATFQQGEICRDRMLAPLAERVHDLALEEAGEEHQETIDFLYELAQFIDNMNESSLSSEFGEFTDLFSSHSDGDLTENGYIGPAFGSLVAIFPSLITNPRLTFAGTAKTESEQFTEMVGKLNSMDAPEARLAELGEIMMEDPR